MLCSGLFLCRDDFGMASACALAIIRGITVFISRLSHSAECDKRFFTRKVVEINGICLYSPSCENGLPERPQTLR